MSDEVLLATKDRLGEYDAIETAKPGEPLFPLQGGDPFAPPTIEFWAKLAREEGLRLTADRPEGSKEHARGERLLEKATQAERAAWEIRAYQKGQDAPTGTRASYSGHKIEIDEASGHEQAVRAARIKAAGLLHNLVGEAVDIADTLSRLDAIDTAGLRNGAEVIRQIAEQIEPRRAHERS